MDRSRRRDLGGLRDLFDGPPVPLPSSLDRLAERFASARPRARLAAGLGVGLVVLLASTLGALRSPWGPPDPVVVAVRDLPAGSVVETADLRLTEWPRDLLPPGAASTIAAVVGQQLAATVPAGTPLVVTHLASHGPAAELPPGRVAYALALPTGVQLLPGQRIDLLAGDGARGGVRLASGADVLSVDGSTAWIAIARDEAPALAAASAWGEVGVALLPP